MENLNRLIQELCNLPSETAYVEFKHDNYTPDMIGKDISALANSAALFEKRNAYMIWGIADKTHSLIGTDKDLQTIKKGGQELENWLRSMLSPNADFEYQTTTVSEKTIGVLTISAAAAQTFTFQKEDYIRIGSYTKKLRDYPAIKAKL
ncbi:ATP-binding protein [Selenomonas noxia]|jgi:putative transcriptional regulator|uniref:AlbA family DNA-binding domain-containing protein n=1 Tax=Selenomonas noxia TaxID=135083 RepID=UPI00288AE035|nr:ATP-binding protein [Selenomonas noxia]